MQRTPTITWLSYMALALLRHDAVFAHACNNAVAPQRSSLSLQALANIHRRKEMPAKGLFSGDHLPSIAVIDSQAVNGLAISPFEEDLSLFKHMFDGAGWKLLTARTRREAVTALSHGPIAVVVCERHLIDGNWK